MRELSKLWKKILYFGKWSFSYIPGENLQSSKKFIIKDVRNLFSLKKTKK